MVNKLNAQIITTVVNRTLYQAHNNFLVSEVNKHISSINHDKARLILKEIGIWSMGTELASNVIKNENENYQIKYSSKC